MKIGMFHYKTDRKAVSMFLSGQFQPTNVENIAHFVV